MEVGNTKDYYFLIKQDILTPTTAETNFEGKKWYAKINKFEII